MEKLQLEAELEAAQIESEVYEAAEQNKQIRVGDVQFEYTPGTSCGPVENGSRPCPHVQTPESEEIQTPKLRLADILDGCFSGPESRGPGPEYQNVEIKSNKVLHDTAHLAPRCHTDAPKCDNSHNKRSAVMNKTQTGDGTQFVQTPAMPIVDSH